jgi:hypothetical protein
MMYCGEVFRLFLWVGLLASTASAQWPRHIHAIKGGDDGTVDSPPARPLAYFTADPRSRPDPDDLCVLLDLCDRPRLQPSASEVAARSRTHTDLRLLGKMGAITFYELGYYLGERPERLEVRSILAETSPNQFYEIEVRQRENGGGLSPAELLDLEQEKLLKTRFTDGGNHHLVWDEYFDISENGWKLLDLKPLFAAAFKVIPRGMDTYVSEGQGDFEVKSLVWRIGTGTSCCEGRVSVTFRLEDGHVIPTGATYEPTVR